MKFEEYLKEGKFVIYKDNEPYEVVGSRKEAKENIQDYQSHPDNKGSKFVSRSFKDAKEKLEKLKPESYKKLMDLDKQFDRVN